MTVAAARLVEVEPDAWDGLLERDGFRDVYFSRDYVEAAASVEPGAAVFLHLDGVIFPVVVREHEGVADATSPTGYGGPLALREDAPVDAFYDLYERWCQSNGIVTTFVRFHPLLANHRYSPFRVEPVAGSVSWRLEGDLFAGMHAHHRRAVRKAERAGVEVDVREAPAGLDAFVALYEETMRRLGASPFYFFGAEYWRLLAKRLRDRIVLLEARLGNEVVASILCFAARPWLHYHLGATAEAGRGAGASHLLMLAAARWAQEGDSSSSTSARASAAVEDRYSNGSAASTRTSSSSSGSARRFTTASATSR